MIFLDILRDDGLNRQDLADKIMSKYKGMIYQLLFLVIALLFQNWLHQRNEQKKEFITLQHTSN